MAEEKLLYFDILPFDDGRSLRGGALVINSRGEPLEFRCTSAVRPTRLQKVLWGARLMHHLRIELIARPLLKAMREPFSLVVVRRLLLLPVRELAGRPLVRVRAPSEKTGEEGEDPAEVLTGGESGPGSWQLQCHRSYAEDVTAGKSMLERLAENGIEVLEPFSRIEAALKLVHEEQTKRPPPLETTGPGT